MRNALFNVLLWLIGTVPKLAIIVAVFARCECIPRPRDPDASTRVDSGQDAGEVVWCFQPGHASGRAGLRSPCFASLQECDGARETSPLSSECWEQLAP